MNMTLNTTLTPKQQELVDGLALDLAKEVKRIEASPKTTDNHYGRYGVLLSSLSKGNKIVATLLAIALVKAGANPLGVRNGLHLFV